MVAYSSLEFLIGFTFMLIGYTTGGTLFLPPPGRLPFMVYFSSHIRGICMGTLISETFVLTAAACFLRSETSIPDTQPIRITYGDNYRHEKRGHHVAAIKIYFPKIPEGAVMKTIFIERAPAILEMMASARAGAEYVPQYLKVNYRHDVHSLDQCITAGWNFYTGYKSIKNEFILQKYLHAQILTVTKESDCERNFQNLTKLLAGLGNKEPLDKSPFLCMIDKAGMYGAPLIFDNAVVGIYTTPNAQYKNCSVAAVYTKLSTYKEFLHCLHDGFQPTFNLTVNIYPQDQDDDSFDMTYYDYNHSGE